MDRRYVIAVALLVCTVAGAYAQTGRFDSEYNLPFNRKAGEVNPQTGSVTISETDVAIPGRAGLDFTFGRTWSLSTAEVFGMYRIPGTGANGLAGGTPGSEAAVGAGWRPSDPAIHIDEHTGSRVMTLFFGGAAYEIDRGGIGIDRTDRSNLLGYDLVDKRVVESTAASYGDYATQAASSGGLYASPSSIEATYGATVSAGEHSAYELIVRDNSRWYFRSDGRLMMRRDPSGINRIWYFYDRPAHEVAVGGEPARLVAVVDTVGREIAFAYDGSGNLSEISWEVTEGYVDGAGVRGERTVTRRVRYEHRSADAYSEVAAVASRVHNYRTPYELAAVVNPAGVRTEYTYRAAESRFTYDSMTSHTTGVWLLLERIDYAVDGVERASSRELRYRIPEGGMGTRYFGEGYREYYRIAEQWWENRTGSPMHREVWRYYGNGEAGNFNRYTAVVERGGVAETYAYSLKSDRTQYETLDTLSVRSSDGYIALTDYGYAADRTLRHVAEYRGGRFAYEESYVYDEEGQLLRHTDRLGLETVTDYDHVYGLPVRTVRQFRDPQTAEEIRYTRTWELTAEGWIAAERFQRTVGAPRTVTARSYTYDGYGNPVSVTDAAGHTVYTTYDTATNTYPIYEEQVIATAAWSDGIEAGWHAAPDISEVRTVALRRVFNSDGTVWLEADGRGAVVETYRDAVGRTVATYLADGDDPVGFVDEAGLTDLRNAADFGALLSARRNNPGTRVAYDDPRAFTQSWTDLDVATGAVLHTAVETDGLGNTVREITYRDGTEYAVTKMAYDEYGRMIALTDPDAAPGGVPFSVNGTTVTRTDRTWIVDVDALGRTVAVLYPETAADVTALKRITYDDATNSATTVDPEGRSVTERRDWAGNVVAVTSHGNADTPVGDVQTIRTAYDTAGRMVMLTDGEGTVTRYRYDERDLLIEQIYETTEAEATTRDRHTYDDRGLLTGSVDRRGSTVENVYDERGLLTETVRRHGDGTLDETVRAVYDEAGNMVWHQNRALTSLRTYDARGRLSSLSRRFADATVRQALIDVGLTGDEQTFTYSYTDADTIREMTYPDGGVHAFSYDDQLGHLAGIEEGATAVSRSPFVRSLDYNLRGVVTRMEYGNDTRQTWQFDQRARIRHTEVTHQGAVLEELAYEIDGSGNIIRINDSTYGYDGFNRVTRANTKIPDRVDYRGLVDAHFGAYEASPTVEGAVYNAVADLNDDGRINGVDHVAAILAERREGNAYDEETFTYDRAGNRVTLTQNGDTYRYTTGERNQLLAVDLREAGETTFAPYADFTYDAAGSLTERVVYTDTGIETTTYTYDSLNRLVQTDGPSGAASYTYDGVGNRVTKRDAEGLTIYLRHGEIAVAMEVSVPTTGGATVDRYVLSGDLIAGRVRSEGATTERAYYHLDHLNSTKLVTDEGGEILVSYTYRAFGEQLKRLDGNNVEVGDEAEYSYGGKELDDTNLYYFNARYYDPVLGRFITVDPIQDGVNWYAYVLNNPLALVDPTGLSPVDPVLKERSTQWRTMDVRQMRQFMAQQALDDVSSRTVQSTLGDIARGIVTSEILGRLNNVKSAVDRLMQNQATGFDALTRIANNDSRFTDVQNPSLRLLIGVDTTRETYTGGGESYVRETMRATFSLIDQSGAVVQEPSTGFSMTGWIGATGRFGEDLTANPLMSNMLTNSTVLGEGDGTTIDFQSVSRSDSQGMSHDEAVERAFE